MPISFPDYFSRFRRIQEIDVIILKAAFRSSSLPSLIFSITESRVFGNSLDIEIMSRATTFGSRNRAGKDAMDESGKQRLYLLPVAQKTGLGLELAGQRNSGVVAKKGDWSENGKSYRTPDRKIGHRNPSVSHDWDDRIEWGVIRTRRA